MKAYPIRYSVNPPTKIYSINKSEELFFEQLFLNLTEIENSNIQLPRMSDGTLLVEYNRYPIGKVKLQGRNHYI